MFQKSSLPALFVDWVSSCAVQGMVGIAGALVEFKKEKKAWYCSSWDVIVKAGLC